MKKIIDHAKYITGTEFNKLFGKIANAKLATMEIWLVLNNVLFEILQEVKLQTYELNFFLLVKVALAIKDHKI